MGFCYNRYLIAHDLLFVNSYRATTCSNSKFLDEIDVIFCYLAQYIVQFILPCLRMIHVVIMVNAYHLGLF